MNLFLLGGGGPLFAILESEIITEFTLLKQQTTEQGRGSSGKDSRNMEEAGSGSKRRSGVLI